MRQAEVEIPSKAARVGSMIEKTGTSFFASVARATPLRCPEHVLSEVDAMAELAGKSRNAMLVYLVEAAIEAVRDTLDSETIERLNATTSIRMAAFLANDSDRVTVRDED